MKLNPFFTSPEENYEWECILNKSGIVLPISICAHQFQTSVLGASQLHLMRPTYPTKRRWIEFYVIFEWNDKWTCLSTQRNGIWRNEENQGIDSVTLNVVVDAVHMFVFEFHVWKWVSNFYFAISFYVLTKHNEQTVRFRLSFFLSTTHVVMMF